MSSHVAKNPNHYKELTFNKQPGENANLNQLSQSFDQKENNVGIQEVKKKNDYINLDEEDGSNNNSNSNQHGLSFFSAQSKDKAEKEEVVVNISNLDMEKDNQQQSILENMNDFVKEQKKNQEKNDLISFDNKASLPEIITQNNGNHDTNSKRKKIIIGSVIGFVIILVVCFLVIVLINKNNANK